jgi:hypothetical protein
MHNLSLAYLILGAVLLLIVLVGVFCARRWPYRGAAWIQTTARQYNMSHAQTKEASRLMYHAPLDQWPADLKKYYRREVLRYGSMSNDGIWETIVTYVKTMSPLATETRTFENPQPFVPPAPGEVAIYHDAPVWDDRAVRRYAKEKGGQL